VEQEVSLMWIRRIGKAVLRGEGWKGKGNLSIILVDDKKIRELNRRFLQSDRPTDVLAFPLEDEDTGVWGEVYVNGNLAREQALMYGVSFGEELARLIVHGVLHLMGYDDGDENSREEMREREDHYLNRLVRKRHIRRE
jgi:probable rRNA maturation factor